MITFFLKNSIIHIKYQEEIVFPIFNWDYPVRPFRLTPMYIPTERNVTYTYVPRLYNMYQIRSGGTLRFVFYLLPPLQDGGTMERWTMEWKNDLTTAGTEKRFGDRRNDGWRTPQ